MCHLLGETAWSCVTERKPRTKQARAESRQLDAGSRARLKFDERLSCCKIIVSLISAKGVLAVLRFGPLDAEVEPRGRQNKQAANKRAGECNIENDSTEMFASRSKFLSRGSIG